MMEDNVFTKAQEDQIRKAFQKIDSDLGLDKYDHKKDFERFQEKLRERAKKVPITEETLERRAEREQKLGDYAQKQRLKESSGRMGGGGGGGLKPDTDITASKKLPKMAKGGKVKSASKRADGCAQRGKTRGRIV